MANTNSKEGHAISNLWGWSTSRITEISHLITSGGLTIVKLKGLGDGERQKTSCYIKGRKKRFYHQPIKRQSFLADF